MYKNIEKLADFHISFPLEKYAPLDRILFLDIETTGLSPATSQLYMIGLAYYTEEGWTIEQWMAQRGTEERELLVMLSEFFPRFTHMIHFNGNRFDIPYLMEKAKEHYVPLDFAALEGIDIFKRIAPFKELLALPNCRLKTVEQFLGINRIDTYTGGELIQIYKSYTDAPNDHMLELLIQHNRDDMKGMLDVVGILAYSQLTDQPLPVTHVQMRQTTDAEGHSQYELLITLKLPAPLPRDLFAQYDGNYLAITGDKVTLKVPVLDGILKFFYSNYKDYYYIPSMDAAFHKSVAASVDASMRQQATAATCYTGKEGLFLKQYDVLVEPFFKKEYKDKASFFEITSETKTDRRLFTEYAAHILQKVLQGDK